ncbi:dnaJ homolog subfamily C member 8-like [Nilaparvata lugens]|uniref:dnaJ homolog subfamily C member 8-like n=1 Tax=Nilaparvata lugens TaxID=108931 RepID=UPI00193CC9B0|nr:dnaJ homolog subfamily C member 8-like [Nilaparvata lugens]
MIVNDIKIVLMNINFQSIISHFHSIYSFQLSILVHPDKNPDDPERAQQAFEIISKAWKTLENDDTRKKCLDVIEEAKARTDHMILEKRKRQKKEGKDGQVEEDDPAAYKHAVYVMTMKLFADMERRRRELDVRDAEERKRKREQEIEEEEKASLEKEWQKNFEVSFKPPLHIIKFSSKLLNAFCTVERRMKFKEGIQKLRNFNRATLFT